MIQMSVCWSEVVRFSKNNPELYESCRKINPDIKPIEEAEKNYQGIDGFLNDLTDIPDEILAVAKFKRVKPLWSSDFKGQVNAETVKESLLTHHVHLPGNELLAINEVFVLENACTERLQEEINNGFRIIAVCPQVAQRRPDYVMGRGFGTKMILPNVQNNQEIPF